MKSLLILNPDVTEISVKNTFLLNTSALAARKEATHIGLKVCDFYNDELVDELNYICSEQLIKDVKRTVVEDNTKKTKKTKKGKNTKDMLQVTYAFKSDRKRSLTPTNLFKMLQILDAIDAKETLMCYLMLYDNPVVQLTKMREDRIKAAPMKYAA